MIKILINNEEVVCSNNLQIKEEMLSTSSTILKNCFPKSWETTKDYVSNYYFPKDYSKCKILDKEEINFTIWGATSQSEGASPDNPQDIIIRTGNTEEIIDGKRYIINLGNLEIGRVAQHWDLLYKENGIWYVRRVMKKLFFDGTENWTKIEQGDNTTMFGLDEDIGYKATGSVSTEGFCNYFSRLINGTVYDGEGFWFTGEGYIRFRIDNTIASTVEEFEEWLSTNEVELYFLKQDTTIETLTDTNLINQLNSIGENLIFCGCVKNTGNISLNPRQPHYVDLQVLDFKTLLSEGETLNYVITGKTIVEAINQVVASISDYGFVVGNIEILNPNDIINAYSTLNKTAYDVFQYIADITQSRWTTRMVDENTIAIDFYDPTLMPEADPIESTQSYYETNKINDITFNYSTNDYRNKQIMTSDEVYANITQTETIIADGYNKNFTCQNKIGTIETITLNGVNQTFITKSQEELGLTADFIYQPGEMQFSSTNLITGGSAIVITYYPIVKGREIILNSSENSRIETQIGRKGTISRYENRNDTTSSAELQKIGQSYIKYKGQAEITLKIVSEKNLFNVGQIVEYQAPLEELSTKYMVKSKTIDWYVSPDKIFYTFELTSNYNYENDINYFDNQRAKSQGNIGEGQVISRNIDLESTTLILFYDTEQAEILPTNSTSLDFALDGVLI